MRNKISLFIQLPGNSKMNNKFHNKYRISSTRLQNWDYGWNASYFITICVKNRKHFFGEILDGEMQLSDIGEYANQFWNEITNHFPFVTLDAFVVMPNHIHGIVIIDKPGDGKKLSNDAPDDAMVNTNPIYPHKNQQMANISPKPGSLSTIIRSYKSVVTKNARQIHPDFVWQSRFNDHIIRNDISFQRIKNYIINNPRNWDNDNFNKE